MGNENIASKFSKQFFLGQVVSFCKITKFVSELTLIDMKRLIPFALSALVFVGSVSCGNPAPKTTSPSFDEVIATRRSVRNYDASKSISQEEITTLLTAVQEAPSWANMEPTKYYVAIGEEKRAALLDMVGGNKERVINAPVLIVSTFERSRSGFFRGQPANEAGELWGAYDNGLSNAYLILKAREMGFDTLIMGMRDADAIREEFEIPESEIILAVISVGYRAEEPKRPERRAFDDVVKFF
jgi:nitroreductase